MLEADAHLGLRGPHGFYPREMEALSRRLPYGQETKMGRGEGQAYFVLIGTLGKRDTPSLIM